MKSQRWSDAATSLERSLGSFESYFPETKFVNAMINGKLKKQIITHITKIWPNIPSHVCLKYGYLAHLVQGDAKNALYWYRRALDQVVRQKDQLYYHPALLYYLFGLVYKKQGHVELRNDMISRIGESISRDPEKFYTAMAWHNYEHFASWFMFGSKIQQHKMITKVMEKHGPEATFWFPRTFSSKTDQKAILAYHQQLTSQQKENKDEPLITWIIKPVDGANAVGIRITDKLEEIFPPGMKNTDNLDEEFIVQEYILHPFLVNQRKFKIRSYVLLTSLYPLRAYIHSEGFLYFSVSPYSSSPSTFDNSQIHISGGMAKDFDQVPPWNFTQFQAHLESQGFDWKEVWEKMKDVHLRALLSTEGEIVKHSRALYKDFSLFLPFILGFDIQLDLNLNPWLLEINPGGGLLTSFDSKKKILTDTVVNAWKMIFPGPQDEDTQQIVRDMMKDWKGSSKAVDDLASLEMENNKLNTYERLFPLTKNGKDYLPLFDHVTRARNGKILEAMDFLENKRCVTQISVMKDLS
eukprot:TRINITY_DN984_c0_g1_i2.p1 TRINITY_DN984_c0_g1~~TRINITY_DN984_c0_g1_i2.p1  ORF type:complete len:523 (+),score=126.87 TRINITY_DN984_c0_g1_i2:487-2055(+)